MYRIEEEEFFVDIYHYSRKLKRGPLRLPEHYALVIEYFEDEEKTQLAFRKLYEAACDVNDKLYATHRDLRGIELTNGQWEITKISPEEFTIEKKFPLSLLEDFTNSVNQQQKKYSLLDCNCQTHVADLLFCLSIQRQYHKSLQAKDCITTVSSVSIQTKIFQSILNTPIPYECASRVLKFGEGARRLLLLILGSKEKVRDEFLDEFFQESMGIIKGPTFFIWSLGIKLLEVFSKVLLKYILKSKGCQEEDAECYSYLLSKAVSLFGTGFVVLGMGAGLPVLLATISAWVISEIITNLVHEMQHFVFKDSKNVWLVADVSPLRKNVITLFDKFSDIIQRIKEIFNFLSNSDVRKGKMQ